MPTATKKALNLPEIREIILDHLETEPATLFRLCLVNGVWFQDTTRFLWRRLKSERHLDETTRLASGCHIAYSNGQIQTSPSCATIIDFSKLAENRQALYGKHIQSIHLDDAYSVELFQTLKLNNIRELNSSFPKSSLQGASVFVPLSQLLEQWQPRLERFSTSGLVNENILTTLESCPRLRELRLTRLAPSTPLSCLLNFLKTCQKLECIDFQFIRGLTEEIFTSVLQNSQITHCSFALHASTRKAFRAALEQPDSLTEKNLLGLLSDDTTVSAVVPHCTKIARLRLSISGFEYADAQRSGMIFQQLGALKHLEELHLETSSHSSIDNDVILSLSEHHQLRSFRITARETLFADDFDDACFERLIQNMPLLEDFAFGMRSECRTVASLDAVHRHCPQIQHLKLDYPEYDLSTWSLDEAPRFPKLKDMEIVFRCTGVKGMYVPGYERNAPRIVIQLLLHHMPQLRMRKLLEQCVTTASNIPVQKRAASPVPSFNFGRSSLEAAVLSQI